MSHFIQRRDPRAATASISLCSAPTARAAWAQAAWAPEPPTCPTARPAALKAFRPCDPELDDRLPAGSAPPHIFFWAGSESRRSAEPGCHLSRDQLQVIKILQVECLQVHTLGTDLGVRCDLLRNLRRGTCDAAVPQLGQVPADRGGPPLQLRLRPPAAHHPGCRARP